MVISPTQLRKGATAAEQKVWPATTTDNDGRDSGLAAHGHEQGSE